MRVLSSIRNKTLGLFFIFRCEPLYSCKKQLFKRLCPSVCRSVRPSVCPSDRQAFPKNHEFKEILENLKKCDFSLLLARCRPCFRYACSKVGLSIPFSSYENNLVLLYLYISSSMMKFFDTYHHATNLRGKNDLVNTDQLIHT